MHRARLAALAIAGTSFSGVVAAPGPASPPVPAPAARMPAASTDDPGDVVPATEKTAAGGDVVTVGVPRFELVEAKGGPLILRARRGAVYAEDAHWISIWNAATGAPLRHLAPRMNDFPQIATTLAVSSDGDLLATGSSHRVRLFRAPFDQPGDELACFHALAFSHDGKLLACSTTTLAIWDVARRQKVASVPANAPGDRPLVAAFTPDDRGVVWTTDHAVLRWDFAGGGSVAVLYQSSARISPSAVAEGGTAACAVVDGKAVVIDAASGKTTPAPDGFATALSPSGKRVATAMPGSLQVTDVATGKPVWTAKLGAPVSRIAFAENDDTLVYVEAHRARVVTLAGPLSVPPQPSRFAGWLGNGVAAIERDGALRALTLATRSWGPADRAALAAPRLDGAPDWASWVAEGSGGRSIAAEPSKRHELAPDARGDAPCDPTLRVWTRAGGARTLTMACSKPDIDGHEDPGWQLGGGWAVGMSATTAILHDARTGKRVATLQVPPRENRHLDYAPAYWQAALAPTGDWLAILWRRAALEGSEGHDSPDPRADAMHVHDAAVGAVCRAGAHGCLLEYFAELWALKGTPRRVWQGRLERSIAGRDTPFPAAPSGVLAFDPAGTRVFIGFEDGEIRIIPTAAPAGARSEHLHRAPIRTLSLDPGGAWAWSGDAAMEQRLWGLR